MNTLITYKNILAAAVATCLLFFSCSLEEEPASSENRSHEGIALSFAIHNGNSAGENPSTRAAGELTVNTGNEDNLTQVRVLAFESATGRQVFNQRFDYLSTADAKIHIVLRPEDYGKPLDFLFLGNEESLPAAALSALQLENTTANKAAFLAKRTDVTHPLSQQDLVDQGYPVATEQEASISGRPFINFADQGFKLFAHRQLYSGEGKPTHPAPKAVDGKTNYPLPYSAIYDNITITARDEAFPVSPVALLHTSARVRITINAAEANAKGVMVVGFRLVGAPKMMHLFYQGHTETPANNPDKTPSNYVPAMNPLDFTAKVALLTDAANDIQPVNRGILPAYNNRLPESDYYGLLKIPYNRAYYKIIDNGKKPIEIYVPEMVFSNDIVPEAKRMRLELILMKDNGSGTPFVYAIEMTSGPRFTEMVAAHTENDPNINAFYNNTLKPTYVALFDRENLFEDTPKPDQPISIYLQKAAVNATQKHHLNLLQMEANARAEQFKAATKPITIGGKSYDMFNQASMNGNPAWSHFSLFRNTMYKLNIIVKDLNAVETSTSVEPWNRVTNAVSNNTYGSGYRIEAVNDDFANGNTATFTIVPVNIEATHARINYEFVAKCNEMTVTGERTGALTTNNARATISVTKPTCFPAGGEYLAVSINNETVANYAIAQGTLDPCVTGPTFNESTGTVSDPDLGSITLGPSDPSNFNGLASSSAQWHTFMGYDTNTRSTTYNGETAYLPYRTAAVAFINTTEGAPRQEWTRCSGKTIDGSPARMMTKADFAILQKYYESLTDAQKADFNTKFLMQQFGYYMLYDDWGIGRPYIDKEGETEPTTGAYYPYVITHLLDRSKLGQTYSTGAGVLPSRKYTETFKAFGVPMGSGYLNFYSRFTRCVKDVPNK